MVRIKNKIQNIISLSYIDLKYLKTLNKDDLYELIIFYDKCINYMG